LNTVLQHSHKNQVTEQVIKKLAETRVSGRIDLLAQVAIRLDRASAWPQAGLFGDVGKGLRACELSARDAQWYDYEEGPSLVI